MGNRLALVAFALFALFCLGCASGAERPATYAEACALPGEVAIEGEASPAGGDVWVSSALTAAQRARVEAGLEAWTAATSGAVRWRVMTAEGGAIRYGAINVFACPAGSARLVAPDGREAGGATSGDAVALSLAWLEAPTLEALVAHEAGHALGLDDSNAGGEVMNPYLPVRLPGAGDVAALSGQ